jgi:anti-sigma B factor antagonist
MLDPRVQLITVSGALDLAAERRLRSDLSEAVGVTSREVVIDLRGVTFMDSSVLAVLVHANQQFQRQGRAIACVTRAGPVRRLLDVTGLRHALLVFETLEEAAAHVLRNAPPGPHDQQRPSSASDRSAAWSAGAHPGDGAG